MMEVSKRGFLAGAAASGLTFGSVARASSGAPLATTRLGRVEGFVRGGAQVFLGLPYGASTAGAARFMPPSRPDPWQGTRDATRLGQRAPQGAGHIYESPLIGAWMTGGRQATLISMAEPEGEDCLVLNVLTPAADARGRPVLFYVHGGGYSSGSGAVMTLADRLVVEQDVVVVTVNHRLGALGFLWLGDADRRYAAGNPGMLDLVAALEWVRDNVAAFGGDPKRVTIWGESGGAAKVALLCAMPRARGLFRAAIMESGLLPEPADRRSAAGTTRSIARTLGAPDGGVASLLSASSAELVRATPEAGPVADGATLTAEPWAVAPPAAIDVPLLLGSCTGEATLFHGMRDPSTFALDWSGLASRLATTLVLPPRDVAEVVGAYLAALPASSPSDVFFRVVSDGSFARAMIRMADRKALQPAPVHLYRMAYDTGIPPGLRAFHTAELPLVGRMVARPAAEDLSRLMAAAWASFARDGRPNGHGAPSWPAHVLGSDSVMTFDAVSGFGVDATASARRLLYAKLGDRAVPYAPAPR